MQFHGRGHDPCFIFLPEIREGRSLGGARGGGRKGRGESRNGAGLGRERDARERSECEIPSPRARGRERVGKWGGGERPLG